MDDEGAAQAATDAAPALADEIVELRKERDTLQDRLLRQAAEFDNYRKRVDRERKDIAQYAAVEFCRTCCRSSTISSARCRPTPPPPNPIVRGSR